MNTATVFRMTTIPMMMSNLAVSTFSRRNRKDPGTKREMKSSCMLPITSSMKAVDPTDFGRSCRLPGRGSTDDLAGGLYSVVLTAAVGLCSSNLQCDAEPSSIPMAVVGVPRARSWWDSRLASLPPAVEPSTAGPARPPWLAAVPPAGCRTAVVLPGGLPMPQARSTATRSAWYCHSSRSSTSDFRAVCCSSNACRSFACRHASFRPSLLSAALDVKGPVMRSGWKREKV
mmetsp:Transcript_45272/g.125943  ORF Transcript_45272/g.125943 Transcript_45272/m.125943 type:complete len:230 (+) Transcript_45272:348-1037(+)